LKTNLDKLKQIELNKEEDNDFILEFLFSLNNNELIDIPKEFLSIKVSIKQFFNQKIINHRSYLYLLPHVSIFNNWSFLEMLENVRTQDYFEDFCFFLNTCLDKWINDDEFLLSIFQEEWSVLFISLKNYSDLRRVVKKMETIQKSTIDEEETIDEKEVLE
jgi:hypothetical protein